MIKRVITLIVAAALLCGACSASGEDRFDFFNFFNSDEVTISKEEYESLKRFSKLAEIYDQIMMYYYQEPDEDRMMEGAIWGMLQGLGDNYTLYYDPDDWQQLWEDDEGSYAGVGIQMLADYNANTVTISRVFKDTPAERAGIRKGDLLIRVDELDVTAETMMDASDIMRGREAETVEIEVVRRGEHIVFTVGRAVITVNWIETAMLDDQVGLIVLYEFAGDCQERLKEGVRELEEQGATALILDLRDNGGGWVEAAGNIADIFLDRQLLFYSESRDGHREEWYTEGEEKDDIPLVVLVNDGTASSSEILSGSLQDLGRALVVGTQTYGKGIMQLVIPLSGVDDRYDGMQVTYAQYFMPSGKKVHKTGITPDVIVEMPEELLGEYFELGDMADVQLQRAWEEAVSLRSGEIALSPAEPEYVEYDEAEGLAAFAPEPLYVSLLL